MQWHSDEGWNVYSEVQFQQMTWTRRPLFSNDPKIIANYLFLYSNYAELVVRHQICLNLTSTNLMMMIACIFLMTTTIKGRGHDVARALSGFVCFPPPTPIHPSTRYLFLCYSHFMHRDYCVGNHCRVAKKTKYFLTANQQNSTSRKVSMSGSQTQLFNYFVSTNPNFATCCNVCFTVSVMAHKRHYDAICIEAERCWN